MADVLDEYQGMMDTATDAEIAAMANVPLNRVKAYRRLRRANVALQPLREAFAHTPVAEIAKATGVPPAAVTAFAEREGLPRYSRRRTAPPAVVDGREIHIAIHSDDLALLGDGTPTEIVRSVIESDDPTNDPWATMLRAAEQAITSASSEAVALNARCSTHGFHADGEPCDMCQLSSRARTSAAKLSEQIAALTTSTPREAVRVRLPATLLERIDEVRAGQTRTAYVEAALRRALARRPESHVHRAATLHLNAMEQSAQNVLRVLGEARALLTG